MNPVLSNDYFLTTVKCGATRCRPRVVCRYFAEEAHHKCLQGPVADCEFHHMPEVTQRVYCSFVRRQMPATLDCRKRIIGLPGTNPGATAFSGAEMETIYD